MSSDQLKWLCTTQYVAYLLFFIFILLNTYITIRCDCDCDSNENRERIIYFTCIQKSVVSIMILSYRSSGWWKLQRFFIYQWVSTNDGDDKMLQQRHSFAVDGLLKSLNFHIIHIGNFTMLISMNIEWKVIFIVRHSSKVSLLSNRCSGSNSNELPFQYFRLC